MSCLYDVYSPMENEIKTSYTGSVNGSLNARVYVGA